LSHKFLLTSSLSGAGSTPHNKKSAFAGRSATAKRLISRGFGLSPPHKSVNYSATQHKHEEVGGKDLTGELFDTQYLTSEGGVRPVSKGEPNGLESTENRRSAGRHGNQHVRVRRPQVTGSVLRLTQVDPGPDAFPIAELCLKPVSTSWRLGSPRSLLSSVLILQETDHASRRRPGRRGRWWGSAVELRMSGVPDRTR
jgi:hypothetical protein